MWIGEWAGLLLIALMCLVTMEVVLRYIFHSPTLWVWDVNMQLLGAAAIIGGGYALLQKAHIGVDVITMHLSTRARAIIELATSWLFFVSVGVLLWKVTLEAWGSLLTREVYLSILRPPIYPFKIFMVVGVLLLLLQGIAEFIRTLTIIFRSKRSGE